ncbi:OmpA family protein [Burkholderia lata]|uniref:OmpA family protein n=1 Tax=Burkholderia lata (strain ATCC 17760 / DSM 23089 / LMG 22485 / NCIMB 9086 / R18194 / 383) TaxID=482957 RepID=A0A6P2TRG2_BURL3|nr:OmpA family protein [Burkholderia lata]VWC59230.1 OmpA family protein [Burkholderia lata]
MLKTFLPALLVVAALAACSPTSGPTFNAYAVDLADGARAYHVECHGLLESTQACTRAAARICGDQPVQTITRRQSLGDPTGKLGDPRALTFRCEAPSAPVAVVPDDVNAPIVLSADALFAFDRGDVDAILPEGRAQLDDAAAKLRAAGDTRHIVVAGYTDRLGSDAYNLRLSQQRADAVKQYLQGKGVTGDIDARGHGAAKPGTVCTTRDREALIHCLASDRRVEIRMEVK